MPEAVAAADSSVVDPREDLLDEIERLAALARAGEWLRVQRLAAALDARIRRLPEAGRRETLAAVYADLERLHVVATSARNEIGEKLQAIRHGRKVTQRYRVTGAR